MDWNILFMAFIAVMTVWYIRGIIVASRKVKIIAVAQGRTAGVIAFAILFVLAIISGNMRDQWYILVGIAIIMVLYMLTMPGLGDAGLYNGGKLIKFEDMHYFTMADGKKGVNVQITTSRRDYLLVFDKKVQEAFVAAMTKHNVKQQEVMGHGLPRK